MKNGDHSAHNPRQKLGLLGGELLRRENALLLRFGQPFDVADMSISWAVSACNIGEAGGRRRSGASPGAPSTDTIGKLVTFTVPYWLVKVSEPWLP
jgi:hypothetical protein